MGKEEIAMEILQRLDAVGEITKEAIIEVIPMAQQHIIVNGVFFLVLGLILLSGLIFSLYKCVRHPNGSSEEDRWISLTMVLALANILTPFLLHEAFINLFATEWQVIKLIINIGG